MKYDMSFEKSLTASKDQGITLKDSEVLILRERDAFAELIKSICPSHMLTLTYRRDPTDEIIRMTTKGFCMRINEELFGSKSKKAVNLIIVVEKRKTSNAHLHIAFQDPTERMTPEMKDKLVRYFGYDFLPIILRNCWVDAGKPYGNITGNPDTIGSREDWYRAVDNLDACAGYMLKELKCGNKELIDYENSVTNGRRISSKTH